MAIPYLVAALAVPDAFGDDAFTLACAYAVVRFAQIWLFVIASRDDPALRRSVTGLASSTATTLVFSRHARDAATLQRLCLVVILTANVVILVRLAGVAAIVQPAILPALLPLLGGGLLAGAVFVAWGWYRLGDGSQLPELELRNPTELGTALTFGAIYAVVLVLSAALSGQAGKHGLYAVAFVSGLTDVDAIVLSSLRLFGQGKLAADETGTAILIALLANLLFKFGIVAGVAGRALALRIVTGFAAIAGGCVLGWLAT